MKKNCLVIISLFLVFGVTSCKKKATPEMIKKYETIMKQKALFNSKYSYEKFESLRDLPLKDAYLKYYTEDTPKKYYSSIFMENALSSCFDRYYIYSFKDESNFEISNIDFERFFRNNVETFLQIPGATYSLELPLSAEEYYRDMLENHKQYHSDLIPGTEEWNLWMMYPINDKPDDQKAYDIDKNGKYNPDKHIYPIEQTCPFCNYKDKIFKETGKINEFNNWSDLYMFNTTNHYWLSHKDLFLEHFREDYNFKEQKKAFFGNRDEKQNSDRPQDTGNNLKKAEIQLISFDTIRKDIQNNKIRAKEKYNGKTLKVKATIDTIEDNRVELLYGPYIFLPKEELKKMSSGQYITFIGTMKFYDYSTSYSGSSDFESWAKDMDKAFNDLDAITKDAESGAMGYSFENCTLLKIEQPEKKTSGWEEVTFF